MRSLIIKLCLTALAVKAQPRTSTCSIISPSYRQACSVVQSYKKYGPKDACLLSSCCYDPTNFRGVKSRYSHSIPACYKPLAPLPATTTPPVRAVPVTLAVPSSPAPVKTSQYSLGPAEIRDNLQNLQLKLELQENSRTVKKTTTTNAPTTTTRTIKPLTTSKAVEEGEETVVAYDDLMSSYKKKTCLQLSTTNTMNDTIREMTMNKMDCGEIQWQNYNPENDPNLQQSSEAGMQLLMSKLKESQDKPAKIIAGGKTELIENSGNVQQSLQAKLEEKIKKSQMKKKQTSSECKKLEENFAKQRKTRFTNSDEKKFKDICGFVPDAEYMFGLITSLQIMREEEAKNWKMPGMALKMELVDWPVIDKCIGRKSVLNKKFNCFARTDKIWNKATCFMHGCIYHGEDCFYCEEAIENMKSTQIAIDQISAGNGECEISKKKRQACKGYNKDDGENLAKNMMMLQMMSNPTMGIMLEKKNQAKCEKLGCCYERNDKKMIMQMMMMNSNAASMQPVVPQTTMNPMMALLGGGSGSSSNMNDMMALLGGGSGSSSKMNDMMAMLSGGSSSNNMMSMLSGGSTNPMMSMLGGQKSSMDPLQMLLSGKTSSSNSFNALSGLGGYGLSSSSGSSSDAMMMSMMMGGNPMNSILMNKLEEDDEFTCYAPIDFEHTDDHECVPDISQNECGVALEDATEHPWNVIFEGPNGDRCGGALICSSWILTTASCLSSLAEDVKDIQAFTDITNGTDLTSATSLTIRQIQKHPMYNSASYGRHRLLHDVAAVQINSISNMPICLPSKSSKNPTVSDEVNTFSYGSVDPTGSFSAEMKRSTFNLLAAKVCEDNYGSVDFSSSLCAEKGSDASNTQNPVCHNDKGSVVATRDSGNYKIVGLIAGGPDNCILTSTTPAVFLSVRKDLQWILEVTNDCCQATMF